MQKIIVGALLLALAGVAHANGMTISNGNKAESIDLSKPFTCPDVNPAPMHITEKGLIMGGVLYPLYDPNASLTPVMTNTIFRSRDNLQEIDVVQYASDGKISVSYMKFRSDPDQLTNYDEIDSNKVFEKASGEALQPKPFFYSKNQGCSQ
ncbi:hypothetical protein LBX38_003260 [Salmonella enterica]|nr:hypothetical protein [Salmonella enterica]